MSCGGLLSLGQKFGSVIASWVKVKRSKTDTHEWTHTDHLFGNS